MIPITDTKTDLYNMVTIRNPLNEDFIFGYDNKGKTIVLPDKTRIANPDYDDRGNYVIKAGETRNFPKFIAQRGMKHLIDKILMMKDDSGRFVNIQTERDEIAKTIFIKEEKFDRPVLPADAQIVDQMNVGSDLDRVLQENKQRAKTEAPIEAVPEVDNTEQFDGLEPDVTPSPSTVTKSTKAKLPLREKMIEYAKSTLSIDPETVIKAKGANEGKTIAQIWDSMTDADLYAELQIEEGDLSA